MATSFSFACSSARIDSDQGSAPKSPKRSESVPGCDAGVEGRVGERQAWLGVQTSAVLR